MSEVATFAPGRFVWIDLATSDPAGAEKFYSGLFGWQRDVNPDPQYGGYGFFKVGGKTAAGVGPTQSPDQPIVWQVYVGTDDAAETARKVEAAGGSVIAPPFDVGNQGKMAVFQDPTGAFISAWQAGPMGGLDVQGEVNSLAWTELQAKDLGPAEPFYKAVFGWDTHKSEIPGSGGMTYTEWQIDGESIGGAMGGMAPVNFWMIYIGVDDVDAKTKLAQELGGQVMLEPQDFPGGRFSIVSDPQGASFGLMKGDPA